MKELVLIYPTQLFEKHPAIESHRTIILIEDPRYFTDFNFHKQKIAFHRASMKAYEDQLQKKGLQVQYVPFYTAHQWYEKIADSSLSKIHYVDPTDSVLEIKINRLIKKIGCEFQKYESPGFLTPIAYIEHYFKGKKKFLMQSFYIQQRKRLNILITKTGQPVGGVWSFDVENRKKYDPRVAIPPITSLRSTEYHREARAYVKKHFKNNPGTLDRIIYPVTSAQIYRWFDDFLIHRLHHFGDFQDAIVNKESFLFHSVLSPLLNTGLLTPEYVVGKTLDFARKHKTPINDLEGFIRQIIGWREFVRAVYIMKGNQQRKSNFFEHKRKLPRSFWNATTGILPLDITIAKLLDTAYAHHIERLMVLGNCMLLCEFHPDQVYQWFMELFIDAYDWVMVPNVYGMSQYADGGLMTTKPYFSSSNYLKQMSDYPKGSWQEICDALFWRFILKHKALFAKMGRLATMVRYADNIKKDKLKHMRTIADEFLSGLDTQK